MLTWLEEGLLLSFALPIVGRLVHEQFWLLLYPADSPLEFDQKHSSFDTGCDDANSQLFDADSLDVLHEVVEVVEVVVVILELVILELEVVRQDCELLQENEVRGMAV